MKFFTLHDHRGTPPADGIISDLGTDRDNPGTDTPAPPVTDGEHGGLVEALGRIPDPRNPRGARYPLVVLLSVAVCVVLAGATSFAAIIDWLLR